MFAGWGSSLIVAVFSSWLILKEWVRDTFCFCTFAVLVIFLFILASLRQIVPAIEISRWLSIETECSNQQRSGLRMEGGGMIPFDCLTGSIIVFYVGLICLSVIGETLLAAIYNNVKLTNSLLSQWQSKNVFWSPYHCWAVWTLCPTIKTSSIVVSRGRSHVTSKFGNHLWWSTILAFSHIISPCVCNVSVGTLTGWCISLFDRLSIFKND